MRFNQGVRREETNGPVRRGGRSLQCLAAAGRQRYMREVLPFVKALSTVAAALVLVSRGGAGCASGRCR